MPTLVVGGGPAGLAAAYHLGRANTDPVLLLERAPAFGGLAAGFRHGPFTLDFGPHRLHAETDPRILADLRAFLGQDLVLKRRRGRIFLEGRYLPFPVGPATLAALGPAHIARIAAGIAAARLSSRPAPPDSYADAVQRQVGRPLYDLFYRPYAEKVWGMPGSAIAAEQAERRVNQRGIGDLLRLALGRGKGRAYYYPRGGFGRIPAAYVQAIATLPHVTLTASAQVQAVHWQGDRLTGLHWTDPAGAKQQSPADHLVWSAPLPELIRRLDPPPPADVRAAAESLKSRAVVLCYVVLDLPSLGAADTYYFPERRFPFNRVIEQKNFDPSLAPPDRTVLGMDLACDPDDNLFRADDAALRARVLPALEAAGLLRGARVLEVFSRRFRQAYPVYTRDYPPALDRAQAWLARFQDLWLIGRQGLFLHNNTHHSLLMGYLAAAAITAPAGTGRATWPARLAEFAAYRVAD